MPDRHGRNRPEWSAGRERLHRRGGRAGDRRNAGATRQRSDGHARQGSPRGDRAGPRAHPATRRQLHHLQADLSGRRSTGGVIRAVKGMRDLLPPTTAVWNHVESIARDVFHAYNYQEIRTPTLEETQLFARGVGEETDIVTKEMYTFEDRDGSSLTLRPENTASVIRAYIEHRLDQRPGVQKLYYMGPMFRRERPQKGRYRQFYQIGAEAIGAESPAIDAEVIEMVVEILARAGLRDFGVLLNSVGCSNCRPVFIAKLRR